MLEKHCRQARVRAARAAARAAWVPS